AVLARSMGQWPICPLLGSAPRSYQILHLSSFDFGRRDPSESRHRLKRRKLFGSFPRLIPAIVRTVLASSMSPVIPDRAEVEVAKDDAKILLRRSFGYGLRRCWVQFPFRT